MPLSIFVAGSIAMIAQAAFLREILATFRGGDLTIGAALLGWLLWTAVGSGPAARLFSRTPRPDILFHRLLPLFGVFATCGVFCIRNVPLLSGLPAGEVVPYDIQFIAVILAFAPCNIIGGMLFVLGAKSLDISKQTSVGSAYTLEALGSAAAGIAVSLLAIPYIPNTGIALLCPVPAFITAGWRFIAKRDYRSLAWAALPLAILIVTASWAMQSKEYQYRGQDLLAETETKYGRLRVTQTHEQITCYADAEVAFSVPNIEHAEYAVHLPMLLSPPAERVLVLGGAASGVVDEILKYRSVKQVTCIELDPAMFTLTDRFLEQPGGRDERVERITADGRAWLAGTTNRYDLIIMGMPAPLSGLTNRYYTREFFKLASNRLTPKGTLSFSVIGDENYLSYELAVYLASVRQTLREIFPDVIALPGVRCMFIAGKKAGMFDHIAWDAFEAERVTRGIETVFARDYYLSALLSPMRMASLTSSLDEIKKPVVNSDTKPSGYVFRSMIQGDLDGSTTVSLIKPVLTPPTFWTGMGVLLGIVLILVFSPGKTSQRTLAVTIATVGLSEISLEILAITAYQSIFGFLYGRIALLTGSYMGGLALGGLLGTRVVRNGRGGIRKLAAVQGLLTFIPLCWIVILGLSTAFSGYRPLFEILFYLLTFLAGTAGGYQFPLADIVHRSIISGSAYRAGTIYSFDLVGSAVGALLIASIMVPVLGMMPVLWFLALLNALTAAAVWHCRKAL